MALVPERLNGPFHVAPEEDEIDLGETVLVPRSSFDTQDLSELGLAESDAFITFHSLSRDPNILGLSIIESPSERSVIVIVNEVSDETTGLVSQALYLFSMALKVAFFSRSYKSLSGRTFEEIDGEIRNENNESSGNQVIVVLRFT